MSVITFMKLFVTSLLEVIDNKDCDDDDDEDVDDHIFFSRHSQRALTAGIALEQQS